jgi:hypothetical protein
MSLTITKAVESTTQGFEMQPTEFEEVPLYEENVDQNYAFTDRSKSESDKLIDCKMSD